MRRQFNRTIEVRYGIVKVLQCHVHVTTLKIRFRNAVIEFERTIQIGQSSGSILEIEFNAAAVIECLEEVLLYCYRVIEVFHCSFEIAFRAECSGAIQINIGDPRSDYQCLVVIFNRAEVVALLKASKSTIGVSVRREWIDNRNTVGI